MSEIPAATEEEETPSTTATTNSTTPNSRLPEIWNSFEEQWNKIGELEMKVEEQVMRKRRRIANLLDEMPKYRKSHLRLFVSHKKLKSGVVVGGDDTTTTATTPANSEETTASTTTSSQNNSYQIIVEGKLLIDHLDHKRAKELDQELYGGRINPEVDASDRSQYRGGIAERESDTPVEPLHFTHLLDQFQAKIHTVYQPVPQQQQPSPNQKKIVTKTTTKRQKGKKRQSSTPTSLEPTPDMLSASTTSTFVWRRHVPVDAQQSQVICTSPDSHAFIIPYTAISPPPSSDLIFHSIVVELNLWPRQGHDRLFQPCPLLSKTLFPQHANVHVPANNSQQQKNRKGNRAAAAEIDGSSSQVISTVNDIFVPTLMTLKEITFGIYQYIRMHELQDDKEPSIINNDKVLQSLFECERCNFADIQFFLRSKKLVTEKVPVGTTTTTTTTTEHAQEQEPCFITYIVPDDSNNEQQQETNSILSFDMDVHVPSLFHYRCRELLRRIKQREFDYTSSRTKARNFLSSTAGGSKNGDAAVRKVLENAVTQRGYDCTNNNVWLALARASPEGSEARATALVDAQISDLFQKAQHHAQAAQDAWNVVDELTTTT